MIFRFGYKSEKEKTELENILKIECKNHFKKYDIFWAGHGVYVELDAQDFFNDIQKMKQSVYKQNELYQRVNEHHEVLLNDWVSEVEENLSFVPDVEVRNVCYCK